MENKQVFAHLCTWFSTKEYSKKWEMWNSDYKENPHNPDVIHYNGERDIAAIGYPLNNLYDSAENKAIEYQMQLMKLCGIDGVIVDWDGRRINSNRHIKFLKLLPLLKKYNLKLIVCFEEWCGYYPENTYQTRQQEIIAAIEELKWLYKNLVINDLYATIEGKHPLPVFRKIKNKWFNSTEWAFIKQRIKEFNFNIMFNDCYDDDLSSVADGYFFWVGGFDEKTNANTLDFMQNEFEKFDTACNKRNKKYIPSVSPGFDDTMVWGWGEKARVAPRYNGQRYEKMWQNIKDKNFDIVQIVTWNDWNEGSQIEPSSHYGYKYLEITQKQIALFKNSNSIDNECLRYPLKCYGINIEEEYCKDVNKLINVLKEKSIKNKEEKKG